MKHNWKCSALVTLFVLFALPALAKAQGSDGVDVKTLQKAIKDLSIEVKGNIQKLTTDIDNLTVDLGIARQRHRIGDPAKFLHIEIALLRARPGIERDDFDTAAAPGKELVAAFVEETNHRRADGSKPGKTDFQRLSHKTSPE